MHIPTIPQWKPAGYDSRQSSTMQIAPGLAYAKGTDFHPGGRALVGEFALRKTGDCRNLPASTGEL